MTTLTDQLTTKDVAGLAGVPTNRISRWTDCGYLQTIHPRGGSGSRCWYSWDQARIAAVLGCVLGSGFRGSRHPWWIVPAAAALAAIDDWAERVLVADDDSVRVVRIDDLPAALEHHVGACTVVSLDRWKRAGR